jgi:uncharacterized protein YfkK (UPF0435 family)
MNTEQLTNEYRKIQKDLQSLSIYSTDLPAIFHVDQQVVTMKESMGAKLNTLNQSVMSGDAALKESVDGKLNTLNQSVMSGDAALKESVDGKLNTLTQAVNELQVQMVEL